MKLVLQQLIRFIVILTIQVMILNNVNILGYMCPFLYLACILMLPLNLSGWLIITISFFTGFIVDIFSGTLGLHSAATVLVGALYKPIAFAIHGKSDIRQGAIPDINMLGIGNYIIFSLILIAIHHITLFFLDTFTFKHALVTLEHAAMNIVLTAITLLLYQLIFRSGRRK